MVPGVIFFPILGETGYFLRVPLRYTSSGQLSQRAFPWCNRRSILTSASCETKVIECSILGQGWLKCSMREREREERERWGGAVLFCCWAGFLTSVISSFFTRNKTSIPHSSAFDHSWHHFGVFYSARISAPLTKYRQFKKREEKRHQQWIFSLLEIQFAEKGNEISVSQILQSFVLPQILQTRQLTDGKLVRTVLWSFASRWCAQRLFQSQRRPLKKNHNN